MPGRHAIAQVTPYPWGVPNEVNEFAARTAEHLADRGHHVLIVAPADRQGPVRASRRALRAARRDPMSLLQAEGPLPVSTGGVPVLSVGEVLSPGAGTGRRASALPIDVARTIEELLGLVALDFVHVHEPFAPSAASAALRHSRALNVGSFHAPSERVVSTQLARRVVELFFGRLDARTASFAATAGLMSRYFPADYRLVAPGCEPAPKAPGASPLGTPADGMVRIVFVEEEERAAQRIFLRALRRLAGDLEWEAVVLSARGASTSTPLREDLRRRVRFADPVELDPAQALATADIVVCASDGTAPAPGLLLGALAVGAVPLATRLPVYEEVLAEGERGLLFEARDVQTLAAQLERLVGDRSLRERLHAGGAGARERRWSDAGGELERIYDELADRRRSQATPGPLRRRLDARRLIDVDLHMHTDHSHDCATPVEVLLATARQEGLGAIAVTDHNEISGALEAQEKADGVKVIVAEEVKTAAQGEVIGLFITERIERGMSLAATVAEIKRQGGLVYVPHPFDRLHAVPDYEHLLPILGDVDAIEIFNPRVAIGSFNEEAARFAAKYRIPAGAGSDAHVPQGLGSVRVRMRDFDGPQEFLASLGDAEIQTKPTSLIYVQALKFLQTRATPPAARQAQRQRRVRRATRNS